MTSISPQETLAHDLATAYAVHGLTGGPATTADVVEVLRGAATGLLTQLGNPDQEEEDMRWTSVTRVDRSDRMVGSVAVLDLDFLKAAAALPRGVDLTPERLADLLGVPSWFTEGLEGDRGRLEFLVEQLAHVVHATVQNWIVK